MKEDLYVNKRQDLMLKQEGKICIICVDVSDHLHNFIIMKGTHKTNDTRDPSKVRIFSERKVLSTN